MQLLIIAIVVVTYLADELPVWSGWTLDAAPSVRILLGLSAYAAVAALGVAASAACKRRLYSSGSWKAATWAERTMGIASWTALLVHALNLAFLGWMPAVRALVGDRVLLDEVAALAPALGVLPILWTAQYPIHRRLREAALIRNLDEGRPVYPIWTRGQFVLLQARLHMGLLLLPVVLVLGWSEIVERVWPEGGMQPPDRTFQAAAMGAGVGVIMLFAPALVRRLWDTASLPPGTLRDRLERLCHAHRVRVRDLLLWNTFGGVINGAVIGLIAPFRYVLLTDALLDSMTTRQVEAVMAHEVAHIRHRHLPWLAVSLIALFAGVGTSVNYGLDWLLDAREAAGAVLAFGRGWVEPASMAITAVVSLWLFGFVSRRFERQADAFAAQHLSGMTARSGGEAVITSEAAAAMSDALDAVARLNHVDREHRAWRHGSIATRQANLARLVGRRCDSLSIDRTVALIKVAAATLLVVSLWFVWRTSLAA